MHSSLIYLQQPQRQKLLKLFDSLNINCFLKEKNFKNYYRRKKIISASIIDKRKVTPNQMSLKIMDYHLKKINVRRNYHKQVFLPGSSRSIIVLSKHARDMEKLLTKKLQSILRQNQKRKSKNTAKYFGTD